MEGNLATLEEGGWHWWWDWYGDIVCLNLIFFNHNPLIKEFLNNQLEYNLKKKASIKSPEKVEDCTF